MEFYRYNNTDLFLTDVALQEISFAYLLFTNNPGITPAELTLAQSWSGYTGIYIFLGNAVKKEDWANFITVLQCFFTTQPIPEHSGVMWLEDYTKLNQGPVVPPDRYSFCTFEVCICVQNQSTGPVDQNYFPTLLYTKKTNENIVQIKNTVNVSIGSYNLPFIENSYISLNEEKEQLEVTYPPLSGALNPAYGRGVSILLSGEAIGVIQGEACIHDFNPDTPTGWNIGLRYNMYSGLSTRSQFYPVFKLGETSYVLFNMQWDPLRPDIPNKTHLLFTGISFKLVQDANNPNQYAIQPETNPGLLPSFWKTIYGKAVLLKPLTNTDNPAKLVFQYCMIDNSETPGYYLAPAGDFELLVTESKDERHKLLCGLSGTECIDFKNGDVLTFYPGNPAFTNSYPVNVSGPDELLIDTCTTSWSMIKSVVKDSPPVYSSAPQTASLFDSSTVPAILGSYYAPAARFTDEVTKDDEYCFPMVPYAGIAKGWPSSFNENDIAPFEQQIINAVRQQVISKIPVNLPLADNADDEKKATTPQGLLVTMKGLAWEKLLLAQNLEATKELSFTPLPGQSGIPVELRNAFQTDDLFLVISDNAHIGKFNNQINIENWNFNLNVPKRDPQKDAEHKNIILFKFRKGAIIDLVADSNNWTAPVTFNYDINQVTSTQTWLTYYCNDAVSLAKKDANFTRFANIIQDENWMGIIALNVDIDLGEFPSDLKALIGAMDLSRFRAHNLGIEFSLIQQASPKEAVTANKTSLFGLINYIDTAYSKTTNTERFYRTTKSNGPLVTETTITESTYSYKVLELKVVFFNSAVSNFESRLQFTARKWFEDAASLTKQTTDDQAPNYSMFFNGKYENHDGHPTYTFLTEKGMAYQYYITSKVLNYVQFIKAQFSTSASTDEKIVSNIEKVSGVFSFIGYLNFNKIENFDFFSYGAETDQPYKGLYFSNLAVTVQFNLHKAENSVTDLSLNFNPTQAAFDPRNSAIRKNSLVANLPLTVTSILTGDKDNAPAKKGFIRIKTPVDFKTNALDKNIWYGLNADFLWGGPGALADQVGFVPQILLAWSPGETDLRTDILICLPGGGGSDKLLSLQNVIKLKIGNLQLVKVENTDKKTINYNLLLSNIGIGFMGLSFPPSGSTNLALLGNPDDPGTLGWYGSYNNKE